MSDVVINLMAGACTGFTISAGLFPIDTIKTRLQSGKPFFQAGGFSKLYSGFPISSLSTVLETAIFFTVYDSTKKFVAKNITGEGNFSCYLISAALAETCSCGLRVPAELFKQRLQVKSTRLRVLVKSVYETEGLCGFYRGFWITLIRELPFILCQMTIYEELRKNMRNRFSVDSAILPIVCGGISGVISAVLTTPVDVIKTRIMLEGGSLGESCGRIFREGGLRGFSAGVVPRAVFIGLGGVLFFGTYENSKIWLRRVVAD